MKCCENCKYRETCKDIINIKLMDLESCVRYTPEENETLTLTANSDTKLTYGYENLISMTDVSNILGGSSVATEARVKIMIDEAIKDLPEKILDLMIKKGYVFKKEIK